MPIVVHRDLAPAFGAARDQGARPTCLAFAASDCHAAQRGPWDPLSCEWLYNRAQTRSGRSHADGATLGSLLDALRLDGQPLEAVWPYEPVVVEPWAPPAVSPLLYRRGGTALGPDFDAIVALLEAGRPAVLLMELSPSFFAPDTDGVVRPAAGERPDPAVRHAVVATAHGSVDGTAALRVRNSWGAGWGLDGSAWMARECVAAGLLAAVELLGAYDVSAD